MADDVVIASERDLEAVLAPLARAKRMVFFAGLPGVGKSLFIRELALAAHTAGRTIHLLQWDVVRPAFVSPAIDARYPGRDGVTHAVIRKAVSQWSRGAVLRRDDRRIEKRMRREMLHSHGRCVSAFWNATPLSPSGDALRGIGAGSGFFWGSRPSEPRERSVASVRDRFTLGGKQE